MTMIKTISAFMAIGLLAACGQTDIQRAHTMQGTGSPFTNALTQEYSDFVVSETDQYNWPDADYFAGKGLLASSGEVVLPEEIDDWLQPPDERFQRDWHLTDDWIAGGNVDEMIDGRARLMAVLNNGAREEYPELAARAQERFDCWLEQQEENHQVDDILYCRDGFWAALEEIEALMAAPEPVSGTPEPMMPDIYIVYFDWDRYDIRPDATAVIADVIGDAANMGSPDISVTGHTDLSGSADYNMTLSLNRADAVRNALIDGGVSASQITTAGRGEAEPAVPTADGVREQANRRAEIIILQ